ncbi:MAG: F0F1 ATP synthase subunit A [Oscillospiraceae bacterium]|nr:F0F1 ATP synthase subunit A [Oscillospiraceae bacterium]
MEETANVLFHIGPLEVTGAVTTTWAIILLLTVISILATRNLKDVPGPLQALAEIAVTRLEKFFAQNLGEKYARKYFSVFATFFIFIIVSNYTGEIPGAGHIVGFSVPSACLSVTAGLAVVAFFTTHTLGIRERGFKEYLLSFTKPVVLLLPITILEQFIRPLSLALRLYGNMYGEELVTENLYRIFAIGMPILMNVLSLIFCFIQAMVFTMLLSIYVAEAVEVEAEE